MKEIIVITFTVGLVTGIILCRYDRIQEYKAGYEAGERMGRLFKAVDDLKMTVDSLKSVR